MLKHVSLAKKIIGGFVIILVLLVVLAGAGRMGLTQVVHKVDRAEDFQVLVTRILDARQNEKQFVLTSDATSADVVKKNILAVKTGAGRITEADPDKEIQGRAEKILAQSDAYETAFDTYVSLAEERDVLMADMNAKAGNALEITTRIRDGQKAEYDALMDQSETRTGLMRTRVGYAAQIQDDLLQAKGYYLVISGSDQENISMISQWKGHMDNIQRVLNASGPLMTEEIAQKRHERVQAAHAKAVSAAQVYFSDRTFENNQALIRAIDDLARAAKIFQQEMQELLEFYVEDIQIFSSRMMALSSGADEIAKMLLQTRILEKEYIRSPDAGVFENIGQNIAAIDAAIIEVKEAMDDPEKTSPLEGIQEGVHAYMAAFENYAALMDRQQTARDQMEASAAGIQAVSLTARDAMRQQMQSQITSSTAFLTGVGVLALVFGLVIAVYLSRIIIRPLHTVVDALKDIARGEGDLTRRIDIRSKDEIGALAEWFNAFISRLNNIVVDISANSETVTAASGELLVTAEQITTDSGELSGRSNSVATAAEEMSTAMNSVAAASEQAATNLESVAQAAGQMKQTIGEVAQNCDKARTVSEKAEGTVNAASRRVEQLGMSANAINQVTETITDIAAQTNLLALNATIEAARAGKAGKGFAVVAGEIKGLAAQTADATQDIQEKIKGIQDSSRATVQDVDAITTVIAEVSDIVAAIAAAIEEQSVSAADVAENIEQAAAGIGEVNENVAQSSQVSSEIATEISQVHQVSDEMAHRSDRMKTSAKDLADLSAKLRTMIGVFKVSADDTPPPEQDQGGRKDQTDPTDIPDLMPWGDDLQLGINSIDEQHKELVRMVNHLHRALKSRTGAKESGRILAELADYTVTHFAHEEKLFADHAYPDRENHEQIHKALVEKVTDFKTRFDAGKAGLSMDLMDFLTDWLRHHILETDKAYVPFFQEKQVQ
ncbi:MAG TPA: bacteriohemerythrin [Desulfotignum sp.]|nr:bacteriohemerythrin [Desulfotignum sp.]